MSIIRFKAPKSYRIYKIVDRPRGPITLRLISWAAHLYLCVLRIPSPIRRSIQKQIVSRDVKLAIRHLIFLTNLSWLPASISGDSYFNPAQDMSSHAIRCLIDLVQQRVTDPFKKHATLADLYGGLIHNICLQHDGYVTNQQEDIKDLEKHQNEHIQALYQHVKPMELSPRSVDSDKLNKNRFCKDDAMAALRDVIDLFDTAGMRFYVISGTLLGAVREQDFLSHDYDIDIGIHYEDLDVQALYKATRKAERFVITARNELVQYTTRPDTGVTEYRMLDKPILIKLCHETGLHIDVFTHIKEGTVRWHGSPIHRWDNVDFELATYKIAGVDVLGPRDYDTYLTENYGDWRTPRTNFNSSIDTPNMAFSRSTKALTYFARAARDLYHYGRADDAERLLKKVADSRTLPIVSEQLSSLTKPAA